MQLRVRMEESVEVMVGVGEVMIAERHHARSPEREREISYLCSRSVYVEGGDVSI